MATLAGVSDDYGVSGGTGTSVSSSGGGGGGDEGTEAPAPALAAATAVNQTGIITASSEEEIVYNCRMCRRAVFSAGDIQAHEAAQHSFHRRKSKGVTSKGLCSSIFLSEPKRWMKQQAGEMEGKLSCPNKACGARLGSLKWTGAQCSCGSWVTPAIQFPRKNLDGRSRTPAGPPPGTVVHPSLLVTAGAIAAIAAAAATPDRVGAADGDGSGGVCAEESENRKDVEQRQEGAGVAMNCGR